MSSRFVKKYNEFNHACNTAREGINIYLAIFCLLLGGEVKKYYDPEIAADYFKIMTEIHLVVGIKQQTSE